MNSHESYVDQLLFIEVAVCAPGFGDPGRQGEIKETSLTTVLRFITAFRYSAPACGLAQNRMRGR